MQKTLNRLNIGEIAQISNVDVDVDSKKRLIAMGIAPGTIVTVEGVAPFGDPMQIKIKDYKLVIRKNDASKIAVNLI